MVWEYKKNAHSNDEVKSNQEICIVRMPWQMNTIIEQLPQAGESAKYLLDATVQNLF